MRTAFLAMGLFLLCAMSGAAQEVKPMPVQAPFPHFSCPVLPPPAVPFLPTYFEVDLTPELMMFCKYVEVRHHRPNYPIETEEKVGWRWVLTIPANGTLKIIYPKELLRLPGCRVTGDEVNHIQLSEEAQDHLTITGTPKTVLTFNCTGFLKR